MTDLVPSLCIVGPECLRACFVWNVMVDLVDAAAWLPAPWYVLVGLIAMPQWLTRYAGISRRD